MTAGALAATSFIVFREWPESSVAIAWSHYANFVEYCIRHIPLLCRTVHGDWNDPLFAGVIAVFAFVPQLGAAFAGGVSASLLARVAGTCSSRRCPSGWT